MMISVSASAKTMVYVSNADSRDIYVMELNQTDGSAAMVEKVATGGTVMPLAVSPDRRFLYASLRSLPYSVSSFSIDSQSGRLNLLSTVPLADNMANLATDKSGRFLLAASNRQQDFHQPDHRQGRCRNAAGGCHSNPRKSARDSD
jgi:6-phosphogluconolactonase